MLKPTFASDTKESGGLWKTKSSALSISDRDKLRQDPRPEKPDTV